jgi:undecaprenyl diphosphate synthase
MLWQIAEAQLFFSAKMWPDFTPQDLEAIFRTFDATERRFGR